MDRLDIHRHNIDYSYLRIQISILVNISLLYFMQNIHQGIFIRKMSLLDLQKFMELLYFGIYLYIYVKSYQRNHKFHKEHKIEHIFELRFNHRNKYFKGIFLHTLW